MQNNKYIRFSGKNHRSLVGMCGVYAIRNDSDSRIYVGSSIDIGRRLGSHLSARCEFAQRSEVHEDMIRLGITSFSFCVLELCDESFLASREQHFIDLNSNSGYNNGRRASRRFVNWKEATMGIFTGKRRMRASEVASALCLSAPVAHGRLEKLRRCGFMDREHKGFGWLYFKKSAKTA